MSIFKFKYFSVQQSKDIHPVGTDAMVLGALVSETVEPRSILDIGTGSGVLALMMAQKFPDAHISGVEKNSFANDIARTNFNSCSFKNKPEVIESSFQDYSRVTNVKYDLIISNPPFFKSSTPAKGGERNMARHQDSLSIEELLSGVESLLSERGAFWLVLPPDQSKDLMQIDSKLKLQKRIELFGKPGNHVRDVLRLSFMDVKQPKVDQLMIRDEKGGYTSTYKSITIDFHGVPL